MLSQADARWGTRAVKWGVGGMMVFCLTHANLAAPAQADSSNPTSEPTELQSSAVESALAMASERERVTPSPVTTISGEDIERLPAQTFRFPGMTVIGSPEAARNLPGSGTYLDLLDPAIANHSYGDINRVLRRVPGVYVREEEGFGLMPNVSLRGVDTGRSSKVTLMEDGILIAPAPYSAPAAYFSPAVGRMEGIEVLKGTSQYRHGPHTTGGVVNYLSTSIPDQQRLFIRTQYGSQNDLRVHANIGNTFDTEFGRVGFLVEGFFRTTDGFKTIDSTPDFRGGDNTGFTQIEPMLKLMWEPNGDVYQRFEFKLGYTDLDADISYLGLSVADFAARPRRRYAGSRFDNIQTEQWRTHIRHYIEPTESFNLTTTAYYNEFDRNWFKLNDLRGPYTFEDGTPVTNPSLSAALAGGGTALAALKGEGAGVLRYRNNKRSYYSYGVESVGEFAFETGSLEHVLTAGIRYHTDRVRRFQHDEEFTQAANGTFINAVEGAPGSQDNRREQTRTLALFISDEVTYGDLTVTGGVRYERLWQRVENFNAGTMGSGTLDLFGGGLGGTYNLNEQWQVFGGVYAGFSPPEPGRRINNDNSEERSIGTEIGVRYQNPQHAVTGEATYFFTQFRDLLVRDNFASGGGNDTVGRVHTQGLELNLAYDPGQAYGWGFGNPYFVTFTYTDAKLRSDTSSANPESIFSGGMKGSHVPYIPEYAVTLGTGLEFERWGIFVSGIYVDSTFTTASNTRDQVNPTTGSPDARFGKTDSHFILDLSAYYRLSENAKLFGGIQNVLDNSYVAARHPHGPRPGSPLFAFIGVEIEY